MEFRALEPYRDPRAEAQALPRFELQPALLRCGRFRRAGFVLSQGRDGQIEFSLKGSYGRSEKRALTRMLGLDLLRESEYVLSDGLGELWVFPGKRLN